MVQTIIIWNALTSIVTGLMYVWDKRVAIKCGKRISERTLLTGAILGGWPGAWLVGQLVRHKTNKRSYRLAYRCCVVVNLCLATAAVLWSGR